MPVPLIVNRASDCTTRFVIVDVPELNTGLFVTFGIVTSAQVVFGKSPSDQLPAVCQFVLIAPVHTLCKPTVAMVEYAAGQTPL